MLLVRHGEAERAGEDRVLAVPAAEERGAGDGEHAHQHGEGGDLHLGIEAAHLEHVLLVMAAVDDAAGAEEEQGLEEGVREQVEQARGPAADAQAEHHVAELADGRVGEHLLDVGHDDGDGGRDERA